MLDEKQVRHVAKLARINLTDKEVKLFSTQLSGVLDYMSILKEVDTEGVEISNQVTGLENVFEEDEIIVSPSTREELLGQSELEIDSNQIKVLKTIK